MANHRIGRVKQEIFRELSDILRTVVKDPRIKNINLMDVEVTGDLQYATIYYSSLSELASERLAEQTGLEKATGVMRHELGQRLTLYKTPELKFKRDESVDYGNHIEKLIRELHTKE